MICFGFDIAVVEVDEANMIMEVFIKVLLKTDVCAWEHNPIVPHNAQLIST